MTSKTSGPRFWALTSTLMSTEGCAVCWIRLCGARGFSNDRSLMYWALKISCRGSGEGGGGLFWPFPFASSAMSLLLGSGMGWLTRNEKVHQRSAPLICLGNKNHLRRAVGSARIDPQHRAIRHLEPSQRPDKAPMRDNGNVAPNVVRNL